jgi:ABC-type multidrug transport system ATPase subunit
MPSPGDVQHTTTVEAVRDVETAAVALDGVVSTIGGFPVLAGLDLRVARGEVVLVSGANGAGKTSLLRLLAGLLPVTAGRAVVLDHDLRQDSRSHRRRVALVAQETFCYDESRAA